MASKTNSKSIRLSNEVMEYINEYEGTGFNEKFENIILFAMKTEIERKKRIAELDKLISARSQELQAINKDLDTARRAANIYKKTMETLRYI